MPATSRAVDLARAAAQAASDKGASDVVLLDVSDQLVLTDVFLLCTGTTDRQVKAVVDGVLDRLRADGVKVVRREGEREQRWVLLDFVDLVVHVMDDEAREHYRLDALWKDCPVVPWESASEAASPRALAERTAAGSGA